MRDYYHRRGRRGGARGFQVRQRERGRGRPLKEIVIEALPEIKELVPKPLKSKEKIMLTIAEYEAMRLVDFEGLNQDEAGQLMSVSRGTSWRLFKSGRIKLLRTLLEGKRVVIEKPTVVDDR
ncbi:MAG: DUF134 domain-containing protein [Candidatus Heimdallarchaeota archaeon]